MSTVTDGPRKDVHDPRAILERLNAIDAEVLVTRYPNWTATPAPWRVTITIRSRRNPEALLRGEATGTSFYSALCSAWLQIRDVAMTQTFETTFLRS